MLILLPPSERKSKAKDLEILFENTKFEFKDEVSEIINTLKSIRENDLEKIYGTSKEKSKLIHEQNLNIFKGKCSAAIERYTGVVYSHLKWEKLDYKSKSYVEKNIRIFSGLFGIVSPKTLIPEYKLKMNVLSLDKFWNPILTKKLKNEPLIIDLLPQIHRKAYEAGSNVKQIDFFHLKNNKKTSAGHLGKSVKGELIKFLAINQITNINDLKSFSFNGFYWDKENFIKKI